MTKINGCLKCVFIFFNSLFGGFGIMLIYGLIKSSAELLALGAPGLGWIWLFAIAVICISCLGIFAARSESAFFLKIFAGFMVVGMTIMLILGIIVIVEKKQAKAFLERDYLKNEELRAELDELQKDAQCCGMSGASDWGDDIPQSCACGYSYASSTCIYKPQGTAGPDKIWGQGCKDILQSYMDPLFKIAMGFFFGVAVIALLGLLISLHMIRQINRHDSGEGPAVAMRNY